MAGGCGLHQQMPYMSPNKEDTSSLRNMSLAHKTNIPAVNYL